MIATNKQFAPLERFRLGRKKQVELESGWVDAIHFRIIVRKPWRFCEGNGYNYRQTN
jgi:hypothetical protein